MATSPPTASRPRRGDELELDFLKLIVDPAVQLRYALQYPGELARDDLNCWAQFEVQNPGTFLGMYHFYAHGRAQRVASTPP